MTALPRLFVAALVPVGLLAGCAKGRPKPIPWSSTSFTVTNVDALGPYDEAVLENKDLTLRFYVPRGGPCAQVIRREARVEYVVLGPLGEIRGNEETCDPVGIGSLRWLRDSRPRPPTKQISPRGQATFHVVYENKEVALVRGRFPLVGLVGWTGGEDTVAVLPKTPECARPIESGVASIEYKSSGPDVLYLLGPNGRCPIAGLARPALGE
jgi:hypothetical protein